MSFHDTDIHREKPSLDDIINGVVVPIRIEDEDSNSRQQAFASDGDAVFLPVKRPNTFSSNSASVFGNSNEAHVLNNQNLSLSPIRNIDPIFSRTGTSIHDSIYPNTRSPSLSSTDSSTGNLVRGSKSLAMPDVHSTSLSIENAFNNSTILLTFQVPLSEVCKNPKSGNLDVLINIVVQIKSTSNIQSFHSVRKWYSDLLMLHKRCQFQVGFPNITTSCSQNSEAFLVNEIDRSNFEKYLNQLSTSILNVDSKSQVSVEVFKFLDDNSNIFFDKMRLVQLETRLVDTISYCEHLKQRLVSTERNLTESTNVVSFLRFKIDQLESNNSSAAKVSYIPNPSNGTYHDQMRSNHYTSHDQTNVLGSCNGALPSKTTNGSGDPLNMNSLRLNDISSTYAPDSNINPSQLIALAEAVLNEKGPLPVGEVGKMLQEATGNSQLSQILKERHNGLKKFLEKFSDKFIMSCDHPFNPHVYLRRSYSPDEQKHIENGSTSYLDKKIKKSRRGKEKKQSWPVANVSPQTISSFQSRIYT